MNLVEGRGFTPRRTEFLTVAHALARQGMLIPRGVLHRARAETRTVVLMVEAASVAPHWGLMGAATSPAQLAGK